LILEDFDKERRMFEKLRAKFDDNSSENLTYERSRIPEKVRIEVWRRDGGKCARCGSREKLEYDHIVPISKGGSNTARNIELLCEKCNRSKSNNVV
jgi:5-methylcytosine-specific restriction endonuclease McrA